jgi:hypothetical protein
MCLLLSLITLLLFFTTIAQETEAPAPSYLVIELKNIFPADFNDFLIDLPLTTHKPKRPNVV